MELFAAATGCSDREVASLYLARAGNDITRAVNHFLDSPAAPVVDAAATKTTASSATTTASATTQAHGEGGPSGVNRTRNSGDNRGTEGSPRRSYKRRRAEPGKGKQQQPCLVFQRARPSVVGTTTSPGVGHRHGKPRDGGGIGSDGGSSGAQAAVGGGGRAAATAMSHPVASAEWTEIAERCKRFEWLDSHCLTLKLK